jgi:hypothetical protein
MDSVYKPLLNAGLLSKNNKSYVMGLSTGARGAAILLLENPSIFFGGAFLSGDFDPTIQKDEEIFTYYGGVDFWSDGRINTNVI